MMRDYLSQIEQTIAATSGRCLLLGPRENIDGDLPSSVTSVTEWHQYPEIDGVFDTLLSIENLASSQDISDMLQSLLLFTHSELSLIHISEPTRPY